MRCQGSLIWCQMISDTDRVAVYIQFLQFTSHDEVPCVVVVRVLEWGSWGQQFKPDLEHHWAFQAVVDILLLFLILWLYIAYWGGDPRLIWYSMDWENTKRTLYSPPMEWCIHISIKRCKRGVSSSMGLILSRASMSPVSHVWNVLQNAHTNLSSDYFSLS